MKRTVSAILLLLLLCSCRSTVQQDKAVQPGSYRHKTQIKFNGLARTYRLHIPEKTSPEPAPLLIVLHGAFSTAKEIEKQSAFSGLADRQGFYVAYPNGIGLFGKLQHWNAGHCCGKAAKDNIDDVGFIETVLNDVLQNHRIDTSRIYLVGYSNGGMMAYRFAEEITERIAALAVVAGALNSTTEESGTQWTPSTPFEPLPVIIFHGSNDQAVPFSGGESPAKADGRLYTSVQNATEFWTMNNKGKAPVQTVELPEWGHAWPGPFFTSADTTADTMKNYDAAQVIWNFFKEHRNDSTAHPE